MNRICRYLQGTKDKGLIFNPSTKLVVGCYADVDFSGLWGNENNQDPFCARSRTEFVVTFSDSTILWVSKLHIGIYLSALHYNYVALSRSVRGLIPLKSITKVVI